ncbi:unnamed protein product [Arabis nemorensis]|uniref:Erythronate-4-phosphate dehydrogenase family protein n=1 Tax=Arabis nemorensis TaxID=586526 RepID=A0A565AR21_9BRAS|nr:unnamed protein product [Arabis nemorensis]
MEEPCETLDNGEAFRISRYHNYSNQHSSRISSPWLDLRVFYVRISNFLVEDSTPEVLTINHIPLDPDTLLEINGVRMSMYSEGCSSQLRRDRLDKKSEEATYVSTDNIRLTGSVKFEVYDRNELVLSGTLEMSDSNGFTGESKNRWNMNCEAEVTSGSGFLKEKSINGQELSSPLPTIEVYVTGCFSGTPIILTKTMQLGLKKKQSRRMALDSIPEYETAESQKNISSELGFQAPDYANYKEEYEGDMYWRSECIDGEMSWFNADSPFFFDRRNYLIAVGCNSKASLTNNIESEIVGCELNCTARKEAPPRESIPFLDQTGCSSNALPYEYTEDCTKNIGEGDRRCDGNGC